MRTLTVCADDAGLAESTDGAILRRGVVRAASVVAGGPTAERFLERASHLVIGLHVNLTEGSALAGPASTLTDAEGRFVGSKQEFWSRALAGRLDPAEVRREVSAQLDWLRARGVEPAFFNGHNQVHVFEAVRACLPAAAWVRVPLDSGLAGPLRAPARAMARAGCAFCGHAFGKNPTREVFLESLEVEADVVEFMVHPGSRPGSPFTESPHRDAETEVLCAPDLPAELQRRGWRLAGFPEI